MKPSHRSTDVHKDLYRLIPPDHHVSRSPEPRNVNNIMCFCAWAWRLRDVFALRLLIRLVFFHFIQNQNLIDFEDNTSTSPAVSHGAFRSLKLTNQGPTLKNLAIAHSASLYFSLRLKTNYLLMFMFLTRFFVVLWGELFIMFLVWLW